MDRIRTQSRVARRWSGKMPVFDHLPYRRAWRNLCPGRPAVRFYATRATWPRLYVWSASSSATRSTYSRQMGRKIFTYFNFKIYDYTPLRSYVAISKYMYNVMLGNFCYLIGNRFKYKIRGSILSKERTVVSHIEVTRSWKMEDWNCNPLIPELAKIERLSSLFEGIRVEWIVYKF